MGVLFLKIIYVIEEKTLLLSIFASLFCGVIALTVMFTASDYFQFDDLLTPEEQAIRMKVRECMEKEVAPIMTKVFPLFSVFVGCANIFLDSVITVIANVVGRKQRYILNASSLTSSEQIF